MATTDTKQKLKDLLRELFQLNNTDLDFGIYRIMNIKAKEVEHFINHEIDKKIETVKNKIIDRQSGDIKAELEEAKAKLEKDFQVDFKVEGDLEAKAAGPIGQLPLFQEPFNRFKEAREKLNNLRVSEDTEKSIYNELYRFFERYYEGGDFVSKPRAGKNNYMIPYEGEEVKLYWANYDQYYIKTGENFKNYLFNNQSADPNTFTQVEFRILDAETAINNNKEEKGRLFIPAEETFEWIADERKLLVKFYYRVPTAEEKKTWGDNQSVKKDNKGINQKLAVLAGKTAMKIGDTELLLFLNKTRTNTKGESIPIFLYHLERYTTVNKFDYFIHKDLKGFLTRELDTFIKNEVFSLAFLNPDWPQKEVEEAIRINTLKATAIRDIALIIIDFVSELEEFQKRLFEKKKFVVESHYCMTLDRIPESVYNEVVQYILTDKDKKQIQDWIDLKFITGNELEPKKTKSKKDDEFSDAKAFLKANDKLVLDTKNLSVDLKWNLLASIENIDSSTNGLLINSENWQALNLLFNKYKNQIQSTYIDPPYNTGSDFAYKDAYRESSWLSLMEGRLKLLKKLLNRTGTIGISIDINELDKTIQLLDKLLGAENRKSIITVRRSSVSGAKVINPGVVNISEYLVIYSVSSANWKHNKIFREKERDTRYNQFIVNREKDYSQWKFKTILEAFSDFKGIQKSKLKKELGEQYESELEKFIYSNSSSIFRFAALDDDSISDEAVKMKYLSKSKPSEILYMEREGNSPYYFVNGDVMLFFEDRLIEVGGKKVFGELVADIWDDVLPNDIHNEGGVTLRKGKKPEKLLERFFDLASNENEIIIDFFGGSGTTGGVAIKANRKFIVVEMANYFTRLTKPRLINTLNGEQSGISKNRAWKGGGIFQYIKLEQYEDTLNNIEIHTTAPQLSFLDNIRYQLIHGTKGSDSLINLDKFTKPFDYTMKIVQQNEPKDTVIDLVTTFNFLLGIEVQRYVLAQNNGLDYKVVIGKKGLQQYIIIWRNFDENSIDLKAEREFITKQDWYNTTAFVYCNGDNAFSAHPIEPEFIRLMHEPVM